MDGEYRVALSTFFGDRMEIWDVSGVYVTSVTEFVVLLL